jgi:hypothetical protein
VRPFVSIAALLDHDVRPAFEPSVVNRNEAGRKAGEMSKHLAEAESLMRFGFREDAQTRYESATVAAADALLALCGGRLANSHRGRAHEVKKHFLVVALTAEGKGTPSVEQVLAITHIRHLVEYGASMVAEYLTPQAADEARQVADIARRSTLEVLADAGIAVPNLPLQEPHAPDTSGRIGE